MRLNLPTKGVVIVRIKVPVLLFALALAATLVAPATASQLVNRDVRGIQLAVNNKGEALVTYRTVRGRAQRVLVWGAVNARQPNPTLRQVRFKLDYAGGWRKYHKRYWKRFGHGCGAYDGPALPWLVTACKASDGSYWALQKWQVQLPNLGFTPWTSGLRQWELHISHWTTSVAKLDVWQDWVYSGRFHHMFGRYTYMGKPIHGFGSSRYGAPTDGYGRLMYLDTLNSAYGSGWKRENSFLPHKPTGVFCYGFFKHNSAAGGYKHPPNSSPVRPKGNGEAYRITAVGPGVTPDVMWTDKGLHDFNARNSADVAFEQAMNSQLDAILSSDRLCRQH
jgi:hypothetical protein